MNNPAVMTQEKMELDLEIPNSLVQTDGQLRRSNSAPMINGLRSLFFHLDLCPFYHDWSLFWTVSDLKANFASFNEWILRFLITSAYTVCCGVVGELCYRHYSDNCQVFQREVLRSRRNSTTVVNRPNMVLKWVYYALHRHSLFPSFYKLNPSM